MLPTTTEGPHAPKKEHPVLLPILRTVAFFAGWILALVGLGLGVTVVMLPAGIVVGIVGVLLIVLGLSARGIGDEDSRS